MSIVIGRERERCMYICVYIYLKSVDVIVLIGDLVMETDKTKLSVGDFM